MPLFAPDKAVDPRMFQILSLSCLFAISLLWYDFALNPLALPLALAGALGVQLLAARVRREAFDWRSPAITGLSVAILLRANQPIWFFLCAALGVAAKFLIRWRGKQVFNPSNIAIVALLLAGSPVWISPGQWGQESWVAGLLIVFAALVLGRSGRFDIAFAFLASHTAMLFGRALYLGDPLAIPTHQLQTVSVLVFTAFMITDPRATPDSRPMRIAFAAMVAMLALYLQIRFQLVGSPIYALACLSPLTPMLDRLAPAQRFQWRKADAAPA